MYNSAIATSNTDIIVNAVVVLFVMDVDEYIFAALAAANEEWTKHTERDDARRTERRGTSTERGGNEEARMRDDNETVIAEMKDEITLLKQQLSSQEAELSKIGKLEQMITELQENSQTRSVVVAASNSDDIHECEDDANEMSMKLRPARDSNEIMIPIVDEAKIQRIDTSASNCSISTKSEDGSEGLT